jgi:hypothetical protein
VLSLGCELTNPTRSTASIAHTSRIKSAKSARIAGSLVQLEHRRPGRGRRHPSRGRIAPQVHARAGRLPVHEQGFLCIRCTFAYRMPYFAKHRNSRNPTQIRLYIGIILYSPRQPCERLRFHLSTHGLENLIWPNSKWSDAKPSSSLRERYLHESRN